MVVPKLNPDTITTTTIGHEIEEEEFTSQIWITFFCSEFDAVLRWMHPYQTYTSDFIVSLRSRVSVSIS